MFDKINSLLNKKGKDRIKLKPIDALDIANIIGENVVSGGVRRTSEIGLFDKNDDDILEAKNDLYKQEDGNWELNEELSHRQMSNNSILYKEKPTREQLHWQIEQMRYSGEPGFINQEAIAKRRDNGEMVNPCAEILLDDRGMCNLVSLNAFSFIENGEINRQKMFEAQRLNARAAYRMALVEFELPEWDHINKRDRLIGLSITGWQDMVNKLDMSERAQRALLQELREVGQKAAKEVAKEYNDNEPVLVTTVKPEGCLDKDHLRVTDQGILTIDDMEEDIDSQPEDEFIDIEGYSRDNNKISQVYNNGSKDIIKLTFRNGRVLKLSKEHPLSVNGEWVEAQNINIDDDVDFEMGTYNKTSHTELKDINTDKKDNLKLPDKMNEDLAWLIGAYTIKGEFVKPINKNIDGMIVFNSKRKELHEKVQKIWDEQFNIKTEITDSNNKIMSQKISSSQIFNWFKKNKFLKKNIIGTSRIPAIIRRSSKKDIISYIMGFIDSKGNNDNGRLIAKYKDNKGLLRHIQEVGEAVGLSIILRDNYEYQNPLIEILRTDSVDDSLEFIDNISVLAKKCPVSDCSSSQKYMSPFIVTNKEVIEDKKTYGVKVDNVHWYYQGALKSHNTQTQMPTVSSGLHYNHSPYYVRRVRINADDPLAHAAQEMGWNVKPEVGQDPDNPETVVVEFPIKAPDGKVKGDVSAIEQLETYKMFMENYVDHNASITVHVRNDEWDEVEEWMWNNWDTVVGISFISHNDNFYDLMPYEEIDEEEYNQRVEDMESFKPYIVNFYEKQAEERQLGNLGCEEGVCPTR